MATTRAQVGSRFFLPRAALEELIHHLRKQGYTVLGPRVADGAIALQALESADQLPKGLCDQQDGGTYRLVEGDPALAFEYTLGPDGPKRHLFPAHLRLFQFHIQGDGFVLDAGPPQVPKLVFLGVRACELAAIRVQDRVFGFDDPRTFRCESEPWYTQVRKQSLFIAVNCTRPSGTCFCGSWGTGPEATADFDLALTELRDGFVGRVGSPRGAALAEELPVRAPTQAELQLADLKIERAREHMGRHLATDGLRELFDEAVDHRLWDDIARRCLSCGNCTMVCPTCFCCSVTDDTDLAGAEVTRTRQWESCFTHQFSYTVAGPERNTIRGRYRHWLRHKLYTYWPQFGLNGCVGCGRCITWCPVAIDLTAEAKRFQDSSAFAPRGAAQPESEVHDA